MPKSGVNKHFHTGPHSKCLGFAGYSFWQWLCSNKMLLMDPKIFIGVTFFTFHEIFFGFLQPFKSFKVVLVHSHTKTSDGLD